MTVPTQSAPKLSRPRYTIALVAGDEQGHFLDQVDLSEHITAFALAAARRCSPTVNIEIQVELPPKPETPYDGWSKAPNIQRISIGTFRVEVGVSYEPPLPQSSASLSPDRADSALVREEPGLDTPPGIVDHGGWPAID